MWLKHQFDLALFILLVLFFISLGSFLMGIIHYPFGFFILLVFIIARLLHLKEKNKVQAYSNKACSISR